MRILWFTLPYANYGKPKENYNGGGWVYSLEKELRKYSNIELAISFFLKEGKDITKDGVSYYPMNSPITKWTKLKYFLSLKNMATMDRYLWPVYESEMLRVVDKYKPDVIQIFGTEECFGLIANKTKIPVIIHIQGIINPYYNAFLPPFFSWKNFFGTPLNIFSYYNKILVKEMWEAQAEREKEIFRRCNFYIGRTLWDKQLMFFFNKNAKYYEGNEILRKVFYDGGKRILPQKLVIVSTISSPLYKGYDVILKTANILKTFTQVDFVWKVFGNINPKLVENLVQINHKNVNVCLEGVASDKEIHSALLESTLYVHTSYIDNSPNSICEAQLLGCTVITTNVGGISSLVENGVSGFTCPSNDPFQMALLILEIYNDKELNLKIGKAAKLDAAKRHNKDTIINDLICVYNKLLKSE